MCLSHASPKEILQVCSINNSEEAIQTGVSLHSFLRKYRLRQYILKFQKHPTWYEELPLEQFGESILDRHLELQS